jgi:hypothetical protein
LRDGHGADPGTGVKFGSSAGNLKFYAAAIDLVVILSGAKDLRYLFSVRKFDDQRCFAPLNMTYARTVWFDD